MRILWAFIISVIIYLLLIGAYLYYFKPLKIIRKKPKDEHIIKIDIRDIPKIEKKIVKAEESEALVPKKARLKPSIPNFIKKPQQKKKKVPKAVESEALAPKKTKPTKPEPIPIMEETAFYEPEIVEPEEIIIKEEFIEQEPIYEEPIAQIVEEIPFVQEEIVEQEPIHEEPIYEEPIYEEPIAEIVKETPPKKDEFIAEEDMLFIPNPMLNESPAQSQSLSSLLGQGSSSQNSPKKSPLIQKLYGSSFDSFTPIQKKFIVDNLGGIHRITQNTLTRRGYPAGAVAMKTGQEGENVVSFDLHPNGDISNLKLEQKVGYRALDENTLETIRVAYKDYPYPKETTHIIFYVEYSIFGY